jgi:hypothetical protein
MVKEKEHWQQLAQKKELELQNIKMKNDFEEDVGQVDCELAELETIPRHKFKNSIIS